MFPHLRKYLCICYLADVREVRGVGLQVTRLEAVGPGQSLKGVLKLYSPLSFPFKYFMLFILNFPKF
jgi:hypothetical protein